jgi:hypothetical protein
MIYLFFIISFLQFSNGFMIKFLPGYRHNVNDKQHPNLENKKLITISPGGTNGFYTFGIVDYLKKNFDLSNYVFSGASSGAWNALFLCYKGDPQYFVDNMLNSGINKVKSIQDIEYLIKDELLNNLNSEDFDFKSLYIGVTTFEKLKFKTTIYNDFEDLNDALDACIISSHIPFITGGLIKKYRNIISFDGGFRKHPYMDKLKPTLHVSHTMWKGKPLYIGKNKEYIESENDDILDIALQRPDQFDAKDLYLKGFTDTKKNHLFLKKRLE